jgi:tetratricopeptide (TPR) repeat protein
VVKLRLRKALDFCLSSDFRDFLGYAFVGVFFFYLLVFVSTAPSPALIAAVAFEICVYAGFLAFRLKRRKAKSVHARQAVSATMLYFIPFGNRLARCLAASVAVFGTLVLLCVVIDAVSFGLAAAGQYKAATWMYTRFPVSQLAGFHPAHTMELLSGAKMKAGRFDDVEKLYDGLYEIRVANFGRRHERICDLYADRGDLSERRKKYVKAEEYYACAIGLSKEIGVPHGCGKYLTRLGELRAQQGRFAEALATLEEARDMRIKAFGAQSQKVADTLSATARVYSRMGNEREAQTVAHQALAIYRAQPKDELNLAFYSAIFSICIMAVGFVSTGKNGWMTRLAMSKIEVLLKGQTISPREQSELEERLHLLRQYAASGKSGDSDHGETRKDREVTQHCGLFLLLASQALR